MSPISLYLAIVQTLAVFIVLGFFVRYWYAEYRDLHHRREQFIVFKPLDQAIFLWQVVLTGISCLAAAALCYIWVSAYGAL